MTWHRTSEVRCRSQPKEARLLRHTQWILSPVHCYRHSGVCLTQSLRCNTHTEHLVSRGHRLFAQCALWAPSFIQPLPRCHICPSKRIIWRGVPGQSQSQYLAIRSNASGRGWITRQLPLFACALALFGRLDVLCASSRLPTPLLWLPSLAPWTHWCQLFQRTTLRFFFEPYCSRPLVHSVLLRNALLALDTEDARPKIVGKTLCGKFFRKVLPPHRVVWHCVHSAQ